MSNEEQRLHIVCLDDCADFCSFVLFPLYCFAAATPVLSASLHERGVRLRCAWHFQLTVVSFCMLFIRLVALLFHWCCIWTFTIAMFFNTIALAMLFVLCLYFYCGKVSCQRHCEVSLLRQTISSSALFHFSFLLFFVLLWGGVEATSVLHASFHDRKFSETTRCATLFVLFSNFECRMMG